MRYPCLSLGVFVLFLAAEIPLPAQYPPGGGYPPGTYPPGSYPPGGVGGIPMPRRGKKKKTQDQENQDLQSVKGMLRKLDEKYVVVEPEDTRIVALKRTGKTKFSKNGEEIKAETLKPGDHLNIECTEDEEGFFYAVNVILEKEGTAEEREQASAPVAMSTQVPESESDRPRQRRKDSKADEEASSEAPSKDAAASPPKQGSPPAGSAELPPPVPPEAGLDLEHIPTSTSSHHPLDDTDTGPPRVQRGKPVAPKSATVEEVAEDTAAAPAPEPVATSGIAPRPLDAPPLPQPVVENTRPADPRIEKAREAATEFTRSLPNYVCQEQMARFVSTTHVVNWQPVDIVSTAVVYENGRESYRNVQINGKAVKKNMEELRGSWSTGEFGSVLVDLFSPATDADFRFRRMGKSGGRDAYVFDFEVDHEHSHWHIQIASQSILPAYRGSIWIDKQTSRTLRIEMQASHLPEAFPHDKVEMLTDYEFVRIGGEREYLLPVHAETLGCERGTNICSHNTIDFRNYHKYTGEAEITFEK